MKESLGIIALDSIHYYVHDLERTREYYTQKLDFTEMGSSSELLASRGKQHSVVFQAGQCRVVVSEPRGTGGRAWRYLQKHPEGVGTIVFRVEDIEKTFSTLEARGGTPMTIVQWSRLADGSQFGQFSVTTPFGDTTFRFVQREGRTIPYPGFKPHPKLRGGTNRFQFSHFDHVTGNFPTTQPIALWLRFVLGFQEYGATTTTNASPASKSPNGAGVKTIVMWDPYSKIKFVLNEPARPNFRASQINLFTEANKGAGIQYIALASADIVQTVRAMRSNDVAFMPAPEKYYDTLPARLHEHGVEITSASLANIKNLGVMVSIGARGAYTLQMFLKDQASQYSDIKAGPFFLQIIQRCGDHGFGASNIRALFEGIEQEKATLFRRKTSH